MNCDYCCNIARKIRSSEELSSEQWANAVKGTNALIHLTITGGEPFIRQDIGELVIGMVKSSGVPHVSINTNGFLTGHILKTTEEILTSLPDIDFTLHVSLDGPAEIHDAVRHKHGAASAVYDTIHGLSHLKKRFPNFKVLLQSLILPENVEVMESFLADSRLLPVDFHEITFPRDITGKNMHDAAMIKNYKKIIKKHRSLTSLESRMFNILNKRVANTLQKKRSYLPCYAGGRMVEILPNGEVIACEMSKVKGESLIGDVSNGEDCLVDICGSINAKQFRNKIAKSCICTFECSVLCNIVFDVKRWPLLLFGR